MPLQRRMHIWSFLPNNCIWLSIRNFPPLKPEVFDTFDTEMINLDGAGEHFKEMQNVLSFDNKLTWVKGWFGAVCIDTILKRATGSVKVLISPDFYFVISQTVETIQLARNELPFQQFMSNPIFDSILAIHDLWSRSPDPTAIIDDPWICHWKDRSPPPSFAVFQELDSVQNLVVATKNTRWYKNSFPPPPSHLPSPLVPFILSSSPAVPAASGEPEADPSTLRRPSKWQRSTFDRVRVPKLPSLREDEYPDDGLPGSSKDLPKKRPHIRPGCQERAQALAQWLENNLDGEHESSEIDFVDKVPQGSCKKASRGAGKGKAGTGVESKRTKHPLTLEEAKQLEVSIRAPPNDWADSTAFLTMPPSDTTIPPQPGTKGIKALDPQECTRHILAPQQRPPMMALRDPWLFFVSSPAVIPSPKHYLTAICNFWPNLQPGVTYLFPRNPCDSCMSRRHPCMVERKYWN
ncbi:hypothetical protein E1B28_012619 [Marasmius oreades]|uniref:Uncharacterized protein n=1 Tax=Marasmius oreades TaxID=181124 RepID=A0A9P7RS46_9AGAR|nr:uncharacterized protein E1B28_012619 [Marasmius oreades]KAG7088647.1 hypothetical protein E1B28_012619 [Marasmius oreades]